jgi:membrane protease YdiL (CAAX protease family)
MQEIPQIRRIHWPAVLTFVVLACAWSWPLFWWRDMHWDSWVAWRIPMPLKNTLLMWGPGIAALICRQVFRAARSRTVTFMGGFPLRAAGFYFVPMLALAAVGIHMPEMGQGIVHTLVIALAVVGLINVLGEELGWRGFLQDALRPLPRPSRYVLIGLIWAGWHFTNLFAHREGMVLWTYLAWYLPLTIVLAALIGEATDRSRAVLVAVTLHAWVDLLWEFPGPGTYAVFAASLPYWGWMLWTWPGRQIENRSVTRPAEA